MKQIQRSAGGNTHPAWRRGNLFKSLMEIVSRQKVAIDKQNYVDRGKLAIRQTSLGVEELQRLENTCYSKSGWRGMRDYFGMTNLRGLAARGENIRIAELADMFVHPMTDEGDK